MSMIFFTYRSQTQARRGASILREAGIPARLDRTPSYLATDGCGFGLWVPAARRHGAALELRGRGAAYEKSFLAEGSQVREVSL